jgi:ribosomal-protein-alanine N-acetyltransferase
VDGAARAAHRARRGARRRSPGELHAQGFHRGWPVADFQSYIAGQDTPVYVACDARRKIAGFAMLRLVADEAELITIAVDRRWRRRASGRR